jgi:hypothetical protein
MTMNKLLLLGLALMLLTACTLDNVANIAPTTANTSGDVGAAGTYMPNLAGYVTTDAANITDAIAAVGGSAALVTGNPIVAAAVAKIDQMISCYRGVGAVAARVYAQSDISTVLQGQLPVVGAIGIINNDRIVNNFLPCALQTQRTEAQAAQPEPCGGSGSFVAASGETITYVYAATSPVLCDQFRASFPAA